MTKKNKIRTTNLQNHCTSTALIQSQIQTFPHDIFCIFPPSFSFLFSKSQPLCIFLPFLSSFSASHNLFSFASTKTASTGNTKRRLNTLTNDRVDSANCSPFFQRNLGWSDSFRSSERRLLGTFSPIERQLRESPLRSPAEGDWRGLVGHLGDVRSLRWRKLGRFSNQNR